MRTPEEQKAAIKLGIDLLSDVIYRQQMVGHYWPADGQIDMAAFFADLHGKVTSAYEESKGDDPTSLVWIDSETGEETSPGKGIPSGLMVSMMEIVFDTLGFFRAIGVEPGALSSDLGVAYEVVETTDVTGALEMADSEDGEVEADK